MTHALANAATLAILGFLIGGAIETARRSWPTIRAALMRRGGDA